MPVGPTADYGLHTACVSAAVCFMKAFPKFTLPHLMTLLPPIWALFTGHFPGYQVAHVNGSDAESDGAADEDGNVLCLDRLLGEVFSFVNVVAEQPSMKKLLLSFLDELFFIMIGYSQMTEDQVFFYTLKCQMKCARSLIFK